MIDINELRKDKSVLFYYCGGEDMKYIQSVKPSKSLHQCISWYYSKRKYNGQLNDTFYVVYSDKPPRRLGTFSEIDPIVQKWKVAEATKKELRKAKNGR